MGANDIFEKVYGDLSFPFLSADQCKIGVALTHPDWPTNTWTAFQVEAQDDRKPAVLCAMTAILRNVDPPQEVKGLCAGSPVLQPAFEVPIGAISTLIHSTIPASYWIEQRGQQLVLEETSAWPAAYSTFIAQLGAIFLIFERHIRQQREKLPFVEFLDQTSRTMPTRHHYALASLGAWAGGTRNCQYLSYFASMPQINDSMVNHAYARTMGYDELDANEIDAGGMIAIPSSLALPLAEAQGSWDLFSGVSTDEINVANPPAAGFAPVPPQSEVSGFLVDRYYRAPFRAVPMDGQAKLGAQNVLRDHYANFYASIDSSELLRCKHYCVPIVTVASQQEIVDLVSRIPPRGEERLFFRGQTELYPIRRSDKVRKFLFGSSCATEPSLVTAAARRSFDYDSLHFALKFFLQEGVFGRRWPSRDALDAAYKRWLDLSISPLCELDLSVMALAQHYGIPTPGLDITTDLGIGLWFATNKFRPGTAVASYEPMTAGDWPADKQKWPVLFVGQVVNHSLGMSMREINDLEEFGLEALRPKRQKALFFLGGHSDHQNRMAEGIVCAFRLAPGDYAKEHSFDELFPRPDLDPAYSRLLEFADSKDFLALGAGKVARYHVVP